jgi:hypothetical protein
MLTLRFQSHGDAKMNAFPLKTLAIAVLLAFAAGPAFAADDGVDDTVPEILNTQHMLRTKLDQPSGEYSRFSQSDLSRMRRAQDKVFRMLDGVSSLDELNVGQRTELSNALDEIKATLASNSDSRLICRRERRIGTNLVEKRCETMAEREARARDSQQQMQDIARTVQTISGG